jgi:hypothetical protein
MEQGKFAYRANLEAARKALLDRTGSTYAGSTAKQQLEQQKEGLMRPKSRPAPEMSGGLAEGIGLALMEAMQPAVEETTVKEEGLKSSLRPQTRSRAGSDIMNRDSDIGRFAAKMKQSESSGRDDVQITTEDGRKMTGGYQFGDARLADYKKANKTKFTTEQFKNDPALQSKVFEWHISDIDKTIARIPGSDKMSLDGLRAVAHLGGKNGMKRFVKSGGTYNPSDDFGTRLSDYYNKFK